MKTTLALIALTALACNRNETPAKPAPEAPKPVADAARVAADAAVVDAAPKIEDAWVRVIDAAGGAMIHNEYQPAVFGYTDAFGTIKEVTVLGGLKGNEWVAVKDQPFKGQWVKPEDFTKSDVKPEENVVETPLMQGGEQLYLVDGGDLLVTVTAKKPLLFIPPINGEYILTVPVEPTKTEAKSHFFAGTHGAWKVAPRVVTRGEGDIWFKADLDNDGTEDQIEKKRVPSEAKPEEGMPPVQNFEIAKVQGGKRTVIGTVSLDGIYLKTLDGALLDLNGDGQLELVMAEVGHNERVVAYDLSMDPPKAVLGYYNGD